MYLNQLVYATTALEVEELIEALKAIERQMGRTAEDRRQGIVRIDLDLMQYNDERHHLRDWERPYIKALVCSCPS
jgi:2-amino-4-hydroxy-6-hydroxymethyldihydropteridine diphosphokinase